METETVRLTELRAPPRNVRIHPDSQIKELARSVQMFGVTRPVVVDEENTVLVGNGLVEACRQLGMDTVPVLRLTGLSQSDKNKVMLSDNKIFHLGLDDEESILQVIKELEDYEVPGFDEETLERLTKEVEESVAESMQHIGINEDEEEDEALSEADGNSKKYVRINTLYDKSETDDDELPKVSAEAVSKRGDVWVLGTHRLMCGDMLNSEDVSQLMKNDKLDCIFTDPPYGINISMRRRNRYQYKDWDDFENDNPEDYPEFISDALKVYRSNARIGCVIYLFTGNLISKAQSTLEFIKAGLHLQGEIIWYKNQFNPSNVDWKSMHESCLYGWVAGSTHTWNGGGDKPSVWKFSRNFNGDYMHPTQKPVALARYALENSTNEGDLVGDFFLGSGSALIACEGVKRACRGMELVPQYVDVAIRRWQYMTGKDAILDGENKTFQQISETEHVF